MPGRTIQLHETVTVDRSVAECYRYLLDFSTIEQWDPGVDRAEKLDDGVPEPGTRFDLTLRFGGRRVPMRYTLDTAEAPTTLVLSGAGEGFTAVDRITLEALDDGRTTIDYRADLSFDTLGVAGSLAATPLLRRNGRLAVKGLADALRVESTPPGLSPVARAGDALILPAAWNFTARGYRRMPDKSLSEFIDDRVVVITGPTSGIGLAAAKLLGRLGARLILVGRDAARLDEACDAIAAFAGIDADGIATYEADLSSIAETRDIGRHLADDEPHIDALVNNAGALFGQRAETDEGHERSLAVNLIAPYVLTELLMPSLRQAQGRVVNVSSGGMYTQSLRIDDLESRHGKYDGAKTYARDKRGLVAMTQMWAERECEAGVAINAMHPGWVATPGVANSLPEFNRRFEGRLRDARMGADTIVWLVTASAAASATGEFWFDRRPHPTEVLPGTAVSLQDRERLVAWLEHAVDAVA